jgi:hypothetical protein
MKKYIVIAILLLASVSWAGCKDDVCKPIQLAKTGYYAGAAASAAAGPVYTDCSQIGSDNFVYFSDYSGDTDKACKTGGTAIDGTISAGEVVAGGTDPGTASPTSAGNVVKLNATNDYIRWPITSGDIGNSSEGKLCFDVYVSLSTGNCTWYPQYYNGTNNILVTFNATNTIGLTHVGNGTSVSMTSTATFTDATWTNVCIRWSVTNNKTSIKIGAGDWEDDADADSVTAFATESSYVYVGYGTIPTDHVLYVDNLTGTNVSGL